MRYFVILIIALVALFIGIFYLINIRKPKLISPLGNADNMGEMGELVEPALSPHPLTIETLRNTKTPGSEIVVEEELENGSNYTRAIVSYRSEGLKIYALLTVPIGEAPKGGWPGIVFNHGYIPPKEYRTTERYVAYMDAFSRNGYVVIKPDYRGHGNSEGTAVGGYGSQAYTIDVLNAFASLQNYKGVNPKRIAMWGHSMGGFITLRAMVVNPDIRAGVIWGGVVGSYEDLLYNWTRSTYTPPPTAIGTRWWRQTLINEYGDPKENPEFWDSISSTSFLEDISGPIQLHHGTDDASVPYQFSEKLQERMEKVGKKSELFLYEGDDHNITQNFITAIERSVKFIQQNTL